MLWRSKKEIWSPTFNYYNGWLKMFGHPLMVTTVNDQFFWVAQKAFWDLFRKQFVIRSRVAIDLMARKKNWSLLEFFSCHLGWPKNFGHWLWWLNFFGRLIWQLNISSNAQIFLGKDQFVLVIGSMATLDQTTKTILEQPKKIDHQHWQPKVGNQKKSISHCGCFLSPCITRPIGV